MDKIKRYLLPVMLVVLFGEIYFYPINSSLRISAGIIALNMIILMLDDISELNISVAAGISIFVLRSMIGTYFSGVPFTGATQYNLPSMAYYLTYGFLALLFRIRKHREHFFPAIMLLSITDSLSNIIEVLVREKMVSFQVVQVFILIGLARSIAAYFVYLLYKKQELFILNREHQKRYGQLNTLVSDIQAEMFYLKKSMGNIEKVMSRSYKLYEENKNNAELQEATLDIAREVHEIKKEYDRVLSGFQSFLRSFEKNGSMTMKDMLAIIKDNTERYLSENNKKITLSLNFEDNLQLKKYYELFTILNNLIINAIDACRNNGIIEVGERSKEADIYFSVKDNGEGIEESILPYIFNPGFTTKYNDSGKASTGIGLSHVINIVEELQGTVRVESDIAAGTLFEIQIPKKSLLG